jgi:hypothetical protein
MMARISYGRPISVTDVGKAAREWYQQDKMSVTKSAPELAEILSFIIDEVINRRKTRAFLFPSGINDPRIDQLYDARLLHLLKKSISSNTGPGKRYDVYRSTMDATLISLRLQKHLRAYSKATMIRLWMKSPPDDYRSIRRAILRPEEIRTLGQAGSAIISEQGVV